LDTFDGAGAFGKMTRFMNQILNRGAIWMSEQPKEAVDPRSQISPERKAGWDRVLARAPLTPYEQPDLWIPPHYKAYCYFCGWKPGTKTLTYPASPIANKMRREFVKALANCLRVKPEEINWREEK